MTTNRLPVFDARRVTDKRLIEMVGESSTVMMTSASEAKVALKLLRKDNTTIVPMIKRMMNTGTPTARKMAAAVISRAFSHITEAYKGGNGGDGWEYRCDWVWNPSLKTELIRQWSVGNIIEETGSDHDEDVILLSSIDNWSQNIRTSDFPSSVPYGTEEYWRGVTALAMSKVRHRDAKDARTRAKIKARYDFYSDVDEFIPWAGNHTDIRLVINTAKERKTIRVSDLESVISQGQYVPALSTAAL